MKHQKHDEQKHSSMSMIKENKKEKPKFLLFIMKKRSFWINSHTKVTNLNEPFWYLNCEKRTKVKQLYLNLNKTLTVCTIDKIKLN